MPYLTAGVAANVPDELGRGVHGPFIFGLHVHVSFPQSRGSASGAWGCLVLHFVSTCNAQVPFAPRGPGARANVCDSDASTPALLKSARHMALGFNGCAVSGHGSEGRQQRLDMGMKAVCLFCYRSVVAVTIHTVCDRAAPRGQIVTTAQVSRPTRYRNATCLPTPPAYCTRTKRIFLGWH